MNRLNRKNHFRGFAGLLGAFLATGGKSEAQTTSPAESARPIVYQLNLADVHAPDPGPWTLSNVPGPNGATRLCYNAKSLGYNHLIVVGPHRLRGGHEYMAELHYEVVTAPQFPHSFYAFARSKTLGNEADVWSNWLGEPGVPGVVRFPLSLSGAADDWMFFLGCQGPGAVIIDQFTIVEGLGYVHVAPAKQMVPILDPPAKMDANSPTGATPFVMAPPKPAGSLVVSATDFGLTPDSPAGPVSMDVATANASAFGKAVDACRTKGAAVLSFPKGVYRFRSKSALAIEDLSDVTLEGNGSELFFENIHPGTAAISISRCQRCIFRNFALDWDWTVTPIASMGKVLAVTPDNLSCDIIFPDLDAAGTQLVATAPWMQMIPMDPETFRITKFLRLSTSVNGFETLNPNTLRVHFKAPVPLEVGNNYCVRHLYYDMSAFRIADGSDLDFAGITIYSMPGMGFVNRGTMHNWEFDNCRIVRRPGSRHPFTTAADGFHVIEAQGNLLVRNCEFTGCGDDCANIHDNCLEGVERVDDHTLKLIANPKYKFRVDVGNTLELCREDLSPTGYTSKVTATAYPGLDTVVTLEQPLPAVVSPASIVWNHDFALANVRIENCYFHDTSGRGVLLASRGGTITGCRFDRTNAHAIQLSTEIVGNLWAEGHGASDIVIEGNTFLNCNAQHKRGGSVIFIAPVLPAGPSAYPIYRDIRIANNQFLNCPGPAVYMTRSENVTVTGNRIEQQADLTNPAPFSGDLLTDYSSNLNLTGNTWVIPDGASSPGVVFDPATTTSVTATGNALAAPK